MVTFDLGNVSLVVAGCGYLESIQSPSFHTRCTDNIISRCPEENKNVLPHSIWSLVICPFISQLLSPSFLAIGISSLANSQVLSKPSWGGQKRFNSIVLHWNMIMPISGIPMQPCLCHATCCNILWTCSPLELHPENRSPPSTVLECWILSGFYSPPHP